MPKSNYTKVEKKAFMAQVKAVRKKLPISYINLISAKTGKSRNIIARIGTGQQVDYEVLKAMQEVAKERKDNLEKFKRELIK